MDVRPPDQNPRHEQPERSGAGTGTATPTGTGTPTATEDLFDHEKLDVYRVTREFLERTQPFLDRRIGRDLREQFDSASVSILANIGEGAGKTARADKPRFYEIAKGSTTETAALLDVLQIRRAITREEYADARALLLRVRQMLVRLAGIPRRT